MSAAALDAGLDALGLALSRQTRDKLLAYLALVLKWNRVYNLTAVREPDKMVSQHLLDSLAVLPYTSGASLADVGSGAGLPGIPLALARPELAVTLIESNHKKSTFLKQAAIELDLENVTVLNERVEGCKPGGTYDVVISRAFSDLREFVNVAGHLAAERGVLAAMKGIYPYDELAQLPSGYRLKEAIPLKVPGLPAERHLMLLERT